MIDWWVVFFALVGGRSVCVLISTPTWREDVDKTRTTTNEGYVPHADPPRHRRRRGLPRRPQRLLLARNAFASWQYRALALLHLRYLSDVALPCRVCQIYFYQNAEGTGLSPFDSWLLLRGVKTMHLRVQKQQENAIRVARFLKAHPCTTHVSSGVGVETVVVGAGAVLVVVGCCAFAAAVFTSMLVYSSSRYMSLSCRELPTSGRKSYKNTSADILRRKRQM